MARPRRGGWHRYEAAERVDHREVRLPRDVLGRDRLRLGCLALQEDRIIPSESTVTIHVGKAGLLKGFGHEHEVDSASLENLRRAGEW